MIVFVAGLFKKSELNPPRIEHSLVLHVCYDADSSDDAKYSFLATDLCLKRLNEGFALELLHAQAADISAVAAACKEAAKATLDALFEITEEKKNSQEGEE